MHRQVSMNRRMLALSGMFALLALPGCGGGGEGSGAAPPPGGTPPGPPPPPPGPPPPLNLTFTATLAALSSTEPLAAVILNTSRNSTFGEEVFYCFDFGGGHRTGYMRALQVEGSTSQFEIRLPPGRLTQTGFVASTFTIELYWTFQQGSLGFTASVPHSVGSLAEIPFNIDADSVFRLLAATQTHLTISGAAKAVALSAISTTQANTYIVRTTPDFAAALASLPPDSVRLMATLAYNYLLALGVETSLYIRRPIVPLANRGTMAPTDLLDFTGLGQKMAERARGIGSAVQIAGTIAMGASILVGGPSLAVGGAVAISVGLLMGTTNSLLYDNLGRLAGDSDSYNLLETASYFASGVIGNALIAFSPLNRFIESADRRISGFLLDQAQSFGTSWMVDRVFGAASGYSRASWHADRYVQVSAPHAPPPGYAPAPPPVTAPAPGPAPTPSPPPPGRPCPIPGTCNQQ